MSSCPACGGWTVRMFGDDSFKKFFHAEYRSVIRFLMSTGACRQDAEEAAADAFRDAERQWKSIRAPKAWIRRVAGRKLPETGRRPESAVSLEELGVDAQTASGLEPAEQVAAIETVLAALRRLPDKQREVMAWTIDGYTPSEIAEHLHEPAANIRQNIKRARENLRMLLAGWNQDDDQGQEYGYGERLG